MWDLFLDWHEFLPHTIFEAVTAIPPAIFGWWWGHRRHDARTHPRDIKIELPIRELSQLTQRIERLEIARHIHHAELHPFDAEGRMGL